MNNSSLYFDGAAVWLWFGLFMLMFLAVVYFGSAYFLEVRKSDRLQKRIEKLKSQLARTQEEYYKATYKVPEVGEDVQMQ